MQTYGAFHFYNEGTQLNMTTHTHVHVHTLSLDTCNSCTSTYMYMYSYTRIHIQCLRDNHNNFNSYLAILSAIESSPTSRLDWPDKILKVGKLSVVITCTTDFNTQFVTTWFTLL